jgi:hypothetical protein
MSAPSWMNMKRIGEPRLPNRTRIAQLTFAQSATSCFAHMASLLDR